MKLEIPCVLLLAASLTAACGKKDQAAPAPSPTPSPEASGASGASGANAAPAPAPAPAAGAVDPAVLAAAKKVAAECTWNEDGYYESSCPARQAWDERSFEQKDAASLVAVLADSTKGLTGLAAQALYQETWLADDKALQEKVFAVAAALPKDSKGGAANKLGRIIGFFDYGKTGLFDKAKAIEDNAEAPEALRIGIANWILAGNPESGPAYDLTRDAAKSGATPGLKTAGLVALSAAYEKHATDEMCALWLDALPSQDDKAGAIIASHLTNGDLQVMNMNEAFPYNWAMIHSDENKCPPATVDAALALIEKRIKDGSAKDSWWVSSLEGPAKSTNATPAQKQKAIELAKKYADNAKLGGYERGQAMEALIAMDAPTAKALATKYAADKDDSLKSAADRVQKKLAEAKP
jgi:hypothetical protein